MKVFFKYGLLPVAIFLLLAVVTVVVAPVLINVQKFVPRLEKEIGEATGRRFSLGHDLSLSFFPWLSLSFSDLQLGNPAGFGDDNFLTIRSFEARIKVLPLLRNRVEISRFVVGGLSLNLQKRADGRGNWQGLVAERADQPHSSRVEGLIALMSRLSFSVLAVTDGQVRWRDADGHQEHRIEEIMLLLNDYTPDKAVAIDAKASLDGKNLAIEGTVGPLLEGGERKIAFDLGIHFLKNLKGKLVGSFSSGSHGSSLAGNYDFPAFSLGELAAAWKSRPAAAGEGEQGGSRLALKGGLAIDEKGLRLENGSGTLDDSAITYSLQAGKGEQPSAFTLHFDGFAAGRYLPLLAMHDEDREQDQAAPIAPNWGLPAVGLVTIDRLDLDGVVCEELRLPATIEERRLVLGPITGKIGGGTLSGDLLWPRGEEQPALTAKIALRQLDSSVLLRQWLNQEGLQTRFDADLDLQWHGAGSLANLHRVQGEVVVSLGQGMILGNDLRQAVLPSASGVPPSSEITATTPFSGGRVVLALTGGFAQIREAVLPLADGELLASGAIDLLQRRLEVETITTTTTSTVNKRGRQEQVSSTNYHSITGPLNDPLIAARHDFAARTDSRQSAKLLLAEKLPIPSEEGLGNLVGKDLVDPAVVAERFRLQPEILGPVEMKKKLPLGAGRIHLGELRQEESLQ